MLYIENDEDVNPPALKYMEYVADSYSGAGGPVPSGTLTGDARSLRTPAPDGHATPATATSGILLFYSIHIV